MRRAPITHTESHHRDTNFKIKVLFIYFDKQNSIYRSIMKKTIALLSAILALNSGCATMFSGSSAMVSVRSDDPAAKLYVDERYVGMGSATVSVPKKGDHHIRVTKEGCSDQTAAMGKKFDATSLLGILIDFGIVSTLLIDGAATGAINDIEPKTYVLNPTCLNPRNTANTN